MLQGVWVTGKAGLTCLGCQQPNWHGHIVPEQPHPRRSCRETEHMKRGLGHPELLLQGLHCSRDGASGQIRPSSHVC